MQRGLCETGGWQPHTRPHQCQLQQLPCVQQCHGHVYPAPRSAPQRARAVLYPRLKARCAVLTDAAMGQAPCQCSQVLQHTRQVCYTSHTWPTRRRKTWLVGTQAAGSSGSRGPTWQPPQQQGSAGPSPPPIVDPNSLDPNGLAGLFMAYAMQLQESMQQQGRAAAGPSPGANVVVKDLGFHPPGAEHPLMDGVSFHLKPNQLGLIIGRSGSGKTTLLQLLAGLSEQTSGDVFIHRPSAGDHASGLFLPTHIEQRMQQVGLVFQFPERHFLGDDVMQEMTFTWPRAVSHWGQRQAMAMRMQQVIDAVGLGDIPFNIPPSALSGGQQRRLALALQLVRAPSLLLLDEPLAGLDWHARREVVALLRELKKEATLLVVSHDLADIAPLVDCAWRMKMGGSMEAVEWPPDSLSDMED